MKNIAVFVSGSGSNLQAVIDGCEKGEINGGVRLVVSSKDGVYALERARKHGIDSAVFSKNQFEELTAVLTDKKIDLIVLAGYLTIIPESFIKKFENKIINIHPSLIPAFSGDGFYGLKVHNAVLERGCKVTGATIHYVNEITDGGKIIMQKAVKVKTGDTPEVLQKRVLKAEHEILKKSVAVICEEKQ